MINKRIVLKFLVLYSVIILLAACGRPTPAPQPAEEKPLFTDADIDSAARQAPEEMIKLLGLEDNEVPAGENLPALNEFSTTLSPQTVLPGTSGFVYYIRSVLKLVRGGTVQVFEVRRHNQTTDTYTTIYSGLRQVQSVAGSPDGNLVVVSMRETTSASSDFEVFLLEASNPGTTFVVQQTSDNVDNINVSMSHDRNRIAFEEPVANVATVIIVKLNGILSVSRTALTQTQPQRQPSLSGDGKYLALVRDLSSSDDRIMVYDIALNRYLAVVTSPALLEHPSVSDNGLKVAWLENATSDQIFLKNLVNFTTQSIASGTALDHPYLTSDGKFITYKNGNAIQAKDLTSSQVVNIDNGLSFASTVYAPVWQKAFENKFIGAQQSGGFPASFGTSVAVDGNLLVASAQGENSGAGAAYVYGRTSTGNWTLVKRLVASDGGPNGVFGADVAVSGDTVVVGARESAYIFQKDQGGVNTWGQVRKITASDGAADDRFGLSVAIHGNTIVIGAYFEDHDTNGVAGDELEVGAAYVYQRNLGGTNNWGQRRKLTASDHAANDTFGCDVAVSGTTVVVGACNESHDTNGLPGDESRVGAAYVFEQNQGGANNFVQVKKLVAGDGAAVDQFGVSVAVNNGIIIVGAHAEDHNADNVSGDEINAGAAYIFQKDQGGVNNWGQVKKLVASDGATFDFFGYSVAVSGNAVVVGAYSESHETSSGSNDTRVGAAYLFHKDLGGVNNWGQVRKLTAFDGAKDDSYSEKAVAISDSVIVIGAWSDDNASGGNAGAIYIY